jgi:uncharacterized heparinase superfamily protein
MRIRRRLRAIGPHPVSLARYTWHQIAVRGQQRWLRRTYARAMRSPRADLRLSPVAVSVPPLPDDLGPAVARIQQEADRALRHEVDLLGSGITELGEVIDWQRDFKSGYRWPLRFYMDIQVTRLTDRSDAKVPWELSRSHHLLALARAASLLDDDRYTAELERQLRAWILANPVGQGINWVNAMEVGIRAVNWVWALRTLQPNHTISDDVLREVTRSLQEHGRHIAANLEGSPLLRSNHYMADILGLLVLGAAIDDDPAARRWFDFAHDEFERQIMAQVHPDGLGFEASLPYHALVLEMLLIARWVAAESGRPFSAKYDERLALMLEATRAVRHPGGRLPQFGDSDSGRILPADSGRSATADNLLWLGAAVLGADAPLDGPPHEDVAWILGVEAWMALQSERVAPPPTKSEFPDGGAFVLRASDLHMVLRCGDVGQNGRGGHAHNDALSFELSAGVPFVVDPGTYLYTADPDARNAFRSTRAHNTVVIDGEEINPIDPLLLFELKGVATSRLVFHEDTGREATMTLSHDGYRRLGHPIEHIRTVLLDRESGVLSVVDQVAGTGTHAAASYLHLAVGVSVEPLDTGELLLENDDHQLMLSMEGADEFAVEESWVSEQFGVRARAPIVVLRTRGPLPLRFGFRFVRIPR